MNGAGAGVGGGGGGGSCVGVGGAGGNSAGSNGLWIDPSGGVWRQAGPSSTTKDQLPGYAQATAQQGGQPRQQQGQGQSNTQQPLPDYER